LAGGFQFGNVPNVNAGGQTFDEKGALDANGNFSIDGGISAGGSISSSGSISGGGSLSVGTGATVAGRPAFFARASVTFDGTNGSILKGNNVSSITLYGTGDYGVNLSVAQADANYTIAGIAQRAATNNGIFLSAPFGSSNSHSSSVVRVVTVNNSAVLENAKYVHVAIFA